MLAESDADRLKIYSDRVALDKLLAGGVEMFRGVAEFKGLRLKAAPFPPVAIAGNRNSLRQVINNLLDNAIKFTSQLHEQSPSHADGEAVTAGEILVELQRDDERNEARIRIRDNGVGIAAEHVPLIFERFYRVDRARTREGVGGSGLGLSICRAIIEAHNGTIAVQSTLGTGTVFTITLPLASVVSSAVTGV